MTPTEQAARWLADVTRWQAAYHELDGPFMEADYDGEYLFRPHVLAAIARHLAPGEWKPIETAPRNGEWFKARTEHGTVRTVHFADDHDRYPISGDGEVWSTAPTEWMPLTPAIAPGDDLVERLLAPCQNEHTYDADKEEAAERISILTDRLAKDSKAHEKEIAVWSENYAALERRLARMEGALTPSAETKADYMGEFSFPDAITDEDGNEMTVRVTVPWTTIKEIMAAIRARAALTDGGKHE